MGSIPADDIKRKMVMGKRSSFKRIERDFYPTPPEAIKPLLPFLLVPCEFTEPCAGTGVMADYIEANTKLKCVEMVDIEPQRKDIIKGDVLTYDFAPTQMFITNPPWDRSLLHPLIERLSDIAPTWLLFDADWMHTKQSIPYMPRLKRIVSVGRVKWIPGSTMTGKDNCCWYLFNEQNKLFNDSKFYGRQP